MTVKYVMAQVANDDYGIDRGNAYVAIPKDDKWIAIHEDDGRGMRCHLIDIASEDFSKNFEVMTKADYELYFNACANGYEDVWTLIRRLYDCN